jgi:Hydrazine synthase alpha subunit middle domain
MNPKSTFLMDRIRKFVNISIILAIGLSGVFSTSCNRELKEGTIIFTQVGRKGQDNNFYKGDSWRSFMQAHIVALNPDQPNAITILTKGLYSAHSPEVSYDAKYLLFTAQEKENDIWQIWEMNLKNFKARQITSSHENCFDPTYLPGGYFVFSKSARSDASKDGLSLNVCNLDGSGLKQITFSPHDYFASTVLKDGRVLTICKHSSSEKREPMFIVMRPDGTKADMFYKGIAEGSTISRGKESMDGKIVFIESGNGSQDKGNIIFIDYNRPLHTRLNLTSGLSGDFRTPVSLKSNKLLVSCCLSEADNYALYEFDPERKALGEVLYNNADYNAFDPVVLEEHERPRKLPSEVDLGVKTGLLLCQDVNFFGPEPSSSLKRTKRIEVLGIDSTLGVIDVEEDGSVYLKIIADTPFQIQSVDNSGSVLNGPSDWIWLRPNERRGCVGCHEDPEIVPENRYMLAVKNPPVSVPVSIIGIKEKEISLE